MFYKMENTTAFVLGYTGATGRALLDELILDNHFTKIVLVGRRTVELPKGADDRFVQEVVNFDEIENFKHVFKDCSVGFCCIGTLTGTAGKTGLVKVDRDYVVNTATVAKEVGCKQFHLLSSQGADKNSMILYSKTKGQAEEGCTNLNFPKLSIYRPGMLLAERETPRSLEKVFTCLWCCCIKCCRTSWVMPVEDLAKAMVNRSKNPPVADNEILDNKAIDAIARET